jgi:hypothetical protein
MSPLAWAARIGPNGSVSAIVGNWVETGDDFLLEGCWSGEFDSTTFDETYSFMGSGVIVRGDDVVVVAPCNTTEAVYSLQHGADWVFANSIPLLLKVGDARLDAQYLDYEADFMSIARGLDQYVREAPLADQRSLGIHFYCNVRIGRDGEIEETPKPSPGPFNSYADYRMFLTEELTAMAANASWPGRIRKYDPIVFCSTGYDSSACAVLGREIGASEAVAFESKRGIRSDSGKLIVEALGYSVIHEKQERSYREFDCAHLFASSGELGTSIFFAGAAAELARKMLLSGVHGDIVWDRHSPPDNPHIVRSPYPDTARTEFRLATGYLNITPAFLAFSRHGDIVRIANSEEMEPWRLDNDYDRPIPRRIVEEAGVPRSWFGQHKGGGAGSSMRFGVKATLRQSMPAVSYDRFSAFLSKDSARRRPTMYTIWRSTAYIAFLGATFLRRRRMAWPSRLLRLEKWPERYKCSPFAPAFLFHWAVAEVQREQYYRAKLQPVQFGTSHSSKRAGSVPVKLS